MEGVLLVCLALALGGSASLHIWFVWFGWCLAGLTAKVLNLLFFTKSPVNCPTISHVEVPLPQTLPRIHSQQNTAHNAVCLGKDKSEWGRKGRVQGEGSFSSESSKFRCISVSEPIDSVEEALPEFLPQPLQSPFESQ